MVDEYTSYYDIPAVQCNQCHKQFAKQEPIQKLSKINHFFKTIFQTSCIRMKRHKKTIEKCCCKEKESAVNSKSSGSITFVDLPWIVPSEYHKNITGPHNQWIFRTGWTPQPDTSALLNHQCGSCISNIHQCSSCDWQEK
ncbi:hypothetical protein MFLAVUS_002112 [Mucor flavus]|uniref:Uncharacterized protein n=1 Tax=Mucor flavus TaxID=439312 RepID=A0ABP9YPH0_9FUNG